MTDVGNILSLSINRQVSAIKSTARTIDRVQLQLASGLKINSAIDGPQNFFTARALDNRASDLQRRLDGIGQSIRTIQEASAGIEAGLRTIDLAEAYAREIENLYESGDPPEIPDALGALISDVLNANPNAIHLGGGVIVQTFTTVGTVTFTPPQSVSNVQYLIVGGGGGGGSSVAFSTAGSGGGGAGGVLEGSINVNTATAYNVVVGAGGAAGPSGNFSGANGGNSSFGVNTGFNLTALGGGGGIGGNGNGLSGGSGGGGRGGVGGTGLQPGTPQGGLGTGGGTGSSNPGNGGGGGGGAGGAGGPHSLLGGGLGGNGYTSLINGAGITVAAGGGGGGANLTAIGAGGSGIGGNGANDVIAATAGAANTGSGGGGGNDDRVGAAGGSGLVVLRYQLTASERAEVELEYERIVRQLDTLAVDSNYRGISLLEGENLTTIFNEDGTSILVTEGIGASSEGLALTNYNLRSIEDVRARLSELRKAREELRGYGFTLAIDLSVITTRQDFTRNIVNTLQSGADDLTVADQNELGAEFLSLQTRQAVQLSVLSTAARFDGFIAEILRP